MRELKVTAKNPFPAQEDITVLLELENHHKSAPLEHTTLSWNWQGRTSAFLVLLVNTVQVLEFHHFQAANQGTVIQDFFVGWV